MKTDTFPYPKDDVRHEMTEEEAKFYTEQFEFFKKKIKNMYIEGDGPEITAIAKEIMALETIELVKINISLVIGRSIGNMMSDPLLGLFEALRKSVDESEKREE